MKVLFLGVGEAFDENIANNSHLILSETRLLLDCGYSAAQPIFKYNPDPCFLDAIYVSHSHADHYFGIPALVVRMWEQKREKPLTIICRKGLKQKINSLIDYGYEGLRDKLMFGLNFIEVEKGEQIKLNELALDFAPTEHPVPNLAVKVSNGRNSVCFSGDGMFTKEAEKLYNGSDLVIHEAYTLDNPPDGHACVKDLVDMALRNKVKCLALTHIQRDLRREKLGMVKEYLKEHVKAGLKVIIPDSGDDYLFDG